MKNGTSLPLKTQILFYMRLGLYLSAILLPVLHPAIVVGYDRISWWMWLFLIPAEMLIAFYAAPPRLSLGRWLAIAAAPLIVMLLFITGVGSSTLATLLTGIAAFLLTAAAFHGSGPERSVTFAEPFLFAFLYYKVLSFSRASEETAAASAGFNQLLIIIITAAFLLHTLILFMVFFRNSRQGRGWKELALFLGAAIPFLLLVTFLIPSDFVENDIIPNLFNREAESEPIPLDLRGQGPPGGNLRSEEDRMGMGDGQGENGEEGEGGLRPSLEGVPAQEWREGMGSGRGNSPQYAVMVVAAAIDPVYAADAYFGSFDPEAGFLLEDDYYLNDLTYRRFLTTWRNPETGRDLRRRGSDIYVLSTLSERYLAYKPATVEPTIRDRFSYPFEFSYNSVSRVSMTGPDEWERIETLGPEEREMMQEYLYIDLPEDIEPSFAAFLDKAVEDQSGYYQRLDAILRSFSSYQYEIGFDDNIHVRKMKAFLTDIKAGDCTEFSNTAAILARMAGIPSRVVTGYLASSSLQTMAHLQGLLMLKEKLPQLADYSLNELFLVTTAHRHSWMQVWMPGYGWVDIETTSHAIPPAPSDNPSNQRIVIPLLDEDRLVQKEFVFPWKEVLIGVSLLTAFVIFSAYSYRYGRQAYLGLRSRKEDIRGLKSLYTLLLMRTIVRGYSYKTPSETAVEYSERHPVIGPFAGIYSRLRYKTRLSSSEKKRFWKELRVQYDKVIKASRVKGLGNKLRQFFSLSGLKYR